MTAKKYLKLKKKISTVALAIVMAGTTVTSTGAIVNGVTAQAATTTSVSQGADGN